MNKKYLLKSVKKVSLSYKYACISNFNSYATNRRYIIRVHLWSACLPARQSRSSIFFLHAAMVRRLATRQKWMGSNSELTRLYSIFLPTAHDECVPVNSTISHVKARQCSVAREQYMREHALGCIALSDVALL